MRSIPVPGSPSNLVVTHTSQPRNSCGESFPWLGCSGGPADPNNTDTALGCRVRGEAPSGLHYLYTCDTSRMYCARAGPGVNTATILSKTTYWTKPELVNQAIQQQHQKLKTAMPLVARDQLSGPCQ